MKSLSFNGVLAALDIRCPNLLTQVSCVCQHFQKSVKLENIICSSNAQLDSLMRNHEKMVRNVFL